MKNSFGATCCFPQIIETVCDLVIFFKQEKIISRGKVQSDNIKHVSSDFGEKNTIYRYEKTCLIKHGESRKIANEK